MHAIAKALVCLPIQFYQYGISPCGRPCCRFYPSCSQYALQAIAYYGVGKGLLWAGRRLLRCHPFAEGGYDPVVQESIMREKA